MSRTGKNFLAGLLDKVTTRSLVNSRWFNRGWQDKLKAKHLTLETLEDRQLLAVGYTEYLDYWTYEDIRDTYPEFNLGQYGSVNTMVLSGTNLTAANLKTAIADAMATGTDDLIVLQATPNNFAMTVDNAPLTIDINTTSAGSLTIVGYGTVDPKITADSDVVMRVNSGTVNLGNLTLVGSQEKSAPASEVLQVGYSAKVTKSDLNLSVVTYWTQDLPKGGDATIWYNEGVYSVDFATTADSVYRSYVTGMTSMDEVDDLLADQYEEGIYVQYDEDNVVYTDPNFIDVDTSDTIGKDSKLNWAGISSDMLSYTGWGNVIATSPEGVYSYYVNSFSDGKGSLEYGLNWFMNGLESFYSIDEDEFATATGGTGNLFDGKYQFDDFGGSIDSRSFYSWNNRSPLYGIDQMLRAGYAVGANLSSDITTLTSTYEVTTVNGVSTPGTPTETTADSTDAATGAVAIWGYKYNTTATVGTIDYYVGLYASVADDDPRGDLANNQLEYLSVTWNSIGDDTDFYYTYEFDGYGRSENFKQTITPGDQTVDSSTGTITQKDNYVDVTTTTIAHLTSFTYLARAEGFAPVDLDRYEPNDTMAQVDSMIAGNENSANLGIISGLVQIDELNVAGTDPCDWFKFETKQGCSIADYVAVQYNTTLFSGDLRISLHTRDADGNSVDLGDHGFLMNRTQISSVDEHGNGTNTWRVAISLAGLEPGEYYVCVERSKSTIDCKDYSLLIQTCSDDAYELNNTRQQVLAHEEGAEDSPNLGQITVPELVISDLIIKQASVYSDARSEIDGFRFIMTGYGGENSWIEIRYDNTDHSNSPNDSDLDLYLYRDFAEGTGYTTAWGDLVAQSVNNKDNGVERISLDGMAPGVYYIKVGGFVNAENLQNYKLIIHLRDEGDLPGIGITADADYYVTTPGDWSGPLVVTSEEYTTYDPEKSDTDKFSNQSVMYTQDTIYINMDLAAAASSEDAKSVKVAVTVNGVRLQDFEITLDKGVSAYDLGELQDIIMAKLTSETWLTAQDGKLWEGINETSIDFKEGMVLNVVNGQDIVTGCYVYHGGNWVSVASSVSVADGTMLTLSDGTIVEYYKVNYKLVSTDVNNNKVVSNLKAIYRTADSGELAENVWTDPTVSLVYVSGVKDGKNLVYDTALQTFTNASTGLAFNVATGSLLYDGATGHYYTYNMDAVMVDFNGTPVPADTFYDWGVLTPVAGNAYCTEVALTLVDATENPASYTYNLTSHAFKNASGKIVTATSGALYTYNGTEFLTYTKTGTKVVFYETIVDLTPYAASDSSVVDPYVTGKALTLADGSVIYYRTDGKFYTKVNVAVGDILKVDADHSITFKGVATGENLLYPYIGVGEGLFQTNYTISANETFRYGATEVEFDASQNKFFAPGTTTQVNIPVNAILTSTDLGDKGYGEAVLYDGTSVLKTSWKQDGEAVTIAVGDVLIDLANNQRYTYNGDFNDALAGHEFQKSGTDFFVRYNGKTETVDSFTERFNTPEGKTLTTGDNRTVVFEDNAFYSLYKEGTLPDETTLTVDAGTVAVRKVIYKNGTFYKLQQADPIVTTVANGATYTVRDGALYETVTSGNFFADGTRFVFYNNVNVDGQDAFASSYLYVTPTTIASSSFGLYTNVVEMVVDPDNEIPEYNESNNKASTSFNIFRYQDDFFIPNQSLEETLNTDNDEIYQSGTQQVANSKYNPNLGAVTGTFVVEDLALVTQEDWFSFEIQGDTTNANTVSISFNPDLGDIDLYVYLKDDNYPGGYKLVGRSATLAGVETVNLNGWGAGTYYIQVKGFRKETNPNYDLTIVGVDPMDISDVALELKDANVINSAALVSWNKLNPENGYVFGGAEEYFLGSEIEWSTDPTFDNIDGTAQVDRYVSQYTISGLAPDTTYYYRVRAYNAHGYSATGEYCKTDWVEGSFKTDDFYKETQYYGLIIGAELYRDYDSLVFASTDARNAYNALLEAAPQWNAENIELLRGNVSKAQIQAAVNKIAASADANDVVFVYYVGLGTTLNSGGETRSLIHTYSDSYTSSQFSDLFNVLDVGQLQVVLNPYYVNSSETDYIDFDYDRFANSIIDKVQDANTTVTVITDANNGENSQLYDDKNDAFGHYFTEALSDTYEFNGETWYVADTNMDGQVSMSELYDYVLSNVSDYTESIQNPQFYPENQKESIVIKGDWKETANNFDHFANDWWAAEGIVVTTAQDVVDSTDGEVSLREAVSYLGNELVRENVLPNGSSITIGGQTEPVSFNFAEAETLGLLPGGFFKWNGTEYTYREGLRYNRDGKTSLVNDGATFTWKDTVVRYNVVDGENIFIDSATGLEINPFAEANSISVTLEDGSPATLTQTGVAVDKLLLDKIVFSSNLRDTTMYLDKSDIQIDDSGKKDLLNTIMIDASSLDGTLTISGEHLIDSADVDEAADDSRRIFTVSAMAEVTIAGLRLTGADVSAATDKFGAAVAVVEGGNLYLANMLIFGNKAENGGAIYVDNNVSELVVVNSTIVDNEAVEGNALYIDGNATVRNSILFDANLNVDPIFVGDGALTLEYSLVNSRTDTTNGNISSGAVTDLANLYKDYANGDYNLVTGAVVINKANPAYARWSELQGGGNINTDLNGIDRRNFGGVDMGAFEWQSKDVKLSTTVTTLYEDDVIDNTISLREAISYVGTTTVYEETLLDMEGDSFIINDETVFAENGSFVTHNAGNFIKKDGVATTIVTGAKLVDLATGKACFYQGNGRFVDDLGNTVVLTEGTSVRYFANPEGTSFIVGTYSKFESVAFTDYAIGDQVECLSDGSTGTIGGTEGDLSVEKTVDLGTSVKFDLDAIKADFIANRGTESEWTAMLTSGLKFNLENSFGGALTLYTGMTIDGTNVIGSDRAAFLNGAGIVITTEEVTNLMVVDPGADATVTLNRLTLTEGKPDGAETAGAITVVTGELQATQITLKANVGALRVNGSSVATLTNSKIETNNDAIYVDEAAKLNLVSSSVYDNTAVNAPVIENKGTLNMTGTSSAKVLIYDNNGGDFGVINNAGILTGNRVLSYYPNAAAIYESGNQSANGGFLTQTEPDAKATFNNSEIRFNTATNDGGAIYATDGEILLYLTDVAGNTATGNGGAISLTGNAEFTIVDSLIRGNQSTFGGGIYMADGAAATLLYTTVAGNLSGNSTTGGNGVYVDNAALTLKNSVIARNYTEGNANNTVDLFMVNITEIAGEDSFVGAVNTSVSHSATIAMGTFGAPLDAQFVTISVDSGTLAADSIKWDLHPRSTAIVGQGDGSDTFTDLNGSTITIVYDFIFRPRTYNVNGGKVSDMGAYTANAIKEVPSTIVTTANDVIDDSDGLISLREAILYASIWANDPEYPEVTERIIFDYEKMGNNIITLEARTPNGNEEGHGATIDLTGAFTINGYYDGYSKDERITVVGSGTDRLFTVHQDNGVLTEVTILGLDLEGGYAATVNGRGKDNGGAFYVEDGTLMLSDCIIRNNQALGVGGAIYQENGNIIITNSLLHGNTAYGSFSGSFNDGGGAVRSVGGWLEIVKSTIARNTAYNSNYSGVYATGSIVTMYDSILANNDNGLDYTADFWATNYSAIANNAISVMWNSASLDGINGNIAGTRTEPKEIQFTDPVNNDFTLKDSSPAINKAAKSFAVYPGGNPIVYDLNGEPLDTLISMGCYENVNIKDPVSTVVTTLEDIVDPSDGLISLREAIANVEKVGEPVTFNIVSESELDGTGWNGTDPLRIVLKSELKIKAGLNLTIDARKNGEAWLEGGVTISGDTKYRIFEVTEAAQLAAYNLHLTQGNGDVISTDGTLAGGAMFISGAGTSVTLYNSVVYNNQALENSKGAAFYLTNSAALELVNCTVAGNTSYKEGAIYVNAGSSLALHNTIVANNNNNTAAKGEPNDVDVFFKNSSALDVVCSVIGSLSTAMSRSGFTSSFVGTPTDKVAVDFVEAPVFSTITGLMTNSDTVDFAPNKGAFIINAGANSYVGYTGFIASLPQEYHDSNSGYIRYDLAGNDRVLFGTVDIGAYEYASDDPEATVEVPSTIVTTLDDIVDAYDGQISLREAIAYAGMSYINDQGKTITLGTTVTFLDSLADGTIVLNPEAGPIAISTTVTIDASALLGGITVDADGASSVFTVSGTDNTVTMNTLTITGGNAGTAGGGGIVHNGGNLVVINSLIYGNNANRGGGIYSNAGTLDLINCTITKNNASIFDDHYGGGYGGLYAITSKVALENTLIALNTSGAATYTDEETGETYSITPDSEFYTTEWLTEHGYFTLDMFVNSSTARFYSSLVGKIQSWLRTPAFAANGNLAGSAVALLDPVFADWDGNDFSLVKSETGVNSPAINAGDSTLLAVVAPNVTKDIAGNNRYVGRVDIGAMESSFGAREMPSTIVTTLEDVVNDADGFISLREAIAYAGTYGLGTTVTFMKSLSGQTFYLDSQLFIDKSVTIDGASLGNNIILSVADEVTDQRIMYVNNGTVTLKGLTLTNHYTQRLKEGQTVSIAEGGAMYLRAGTLNLYNTLVFDNYATQGSAIYVNDGSTVNLNIMNSTITDNRVAAGGATVYAGNGRVNIQNSIIARNGLSTNVALDLTAGNVNVANSFIQRTDSVNPEQGHGKNGNYIGTTAAPITDEANLLFVDWANDDFQLNDASIAVNAGDNTYTLYDATGKKVVFSGLINFSENDVVGNKRLVGQNVDMGAMENQVVTDNYYTVSIDDITVTTQFDVVDPSDGLVSLREAVAMAEHMYDLGINKKVTFSTVYLADNAVMNMGTENLVISRPITIDASMINSFVIDAGGKNNIFYIDTTSYANESVTILNMEFRNGSAARGGAIYHVGGDLILLNTLIHSNTAVFASTASATPSYGGGLYSEKGNVTMVNCTVANNTASYGGGIYISAGNLTLYNSIVARNFVVGGTDTTNVDLAVNTASYDIQYSLLGNAYSFRALNGVLHNQVGYGDDNSIDPLFISVSTGNFRLDAGSPARGAANFEFVYQYGFQYDLDGNRIGNNTNSIEFWNMLQYISRAENRGVTTLEELEADMAETQETGAMAQNVLNDSYSGSVNSISGLYAYYTGLEHDADTAELAISLMTWYSWSVEETTLEGYLKFLETGGYTTVLEYCNKVIEKRSGSDDTKVTTLEGLKAALNGEIYVIENMNIPARRAFVTETVDESGATTIAQLRTYLEALITDASSVDDLADFIDKAETPFTTIEEIKVALRDEISSSVAIGAYQPTREAPSTIVTTELDVVDSTDGLISLREALTVYDTNNRYAYYKAQEGGSAVVVGYSGVGGAYGTSASTSSFYSDERLIVNYSPVTFAEHMAGKTIKLDAAKGSIQLTNYVLGTVYYYLVDASSIASLGGITIDASGCEYAFEAIGDKLKDVDLIAISYAEFEGIRVTGAEVAAFRVDPYSVVETRNSLIYRNGNAFRIEDHVENNIRYYGIAHVYNCTVTNNSQYAFNNFGKVFGYNSIFSLNGYGTSGSASEVSLANCLCQSPVTPSYDVYGSNNIYVNNPLFVDQANDDYHLSRFSLAINTGNPDYLATNRPTHAQAQTDLDGNPRTWNGLQGVVDIGCYEMTGRVSEEGEIIGYVDVPSTVVTTNEDVVDASDGLISIREAIAYAEQYQYMKYSPDVRNGLRIDRVVTFDASLNGTTITLKNGAIELTNDITIDARALSNGIIFDGDKKSNIFTIDIAQSKFRNAIENSKVNVYLYNIDMTNGSGENGGAVYIKSGNVLVQDCDLYGNTASSNGGAIYVYDSELTLRGVNIGGNKATYYGGVASFNGTVLFDNTWIANNKATAAGADYDFYFETVGNENSTDSSKSVFGSTRNLRLTGHGAAGDMNWIGTKDNELWDYGKAGFVETVDEIFDATQGSWDENDNWTGILARNAAISFNPQASAAALPEQTATRANSALAASASFFASLEEEQTDILSPWFEEP